MTTQLETASGNEDVLAVWDGPEGDHWTEYAARYDAAAAAFSSALVDAVQVDERSAVLDIGCGTGELTLALGRRAPAGSALGIDLSARMLEHGTAAARAEGLDHVRFEQADAQVHPFPTDAYDVAASSFGCMFFADPVAAFANIGRAMRPGAPLVLTVWRDLDRNEWVTEFRAALASGRDLPTPPPGAPTPFGMADRAVTTDRLTAAGFRDVTFTSIDEPMRWGRDVDDVWPFISSFGLVRGLTADLDEAARAEALRRLRMSLEAHTTADGVNYAGSAWVITARNG